MPKNFRQIPDEVRRRLETFALDDVVAACAKRLRPQDVGRYSHLGLRLVSGQLVVPPPFVPDAGGGKYSRANVEGKEVIRHDLQKIQKEVCFYAPNWGDASNGMHLVCHTRDVYQRDFIPPKEVELAITVLDDRDGSFLVKFAIDQVINRRSADFDAELLYNLNILQENVGAADVFESEATLADYAATIRVDWELLPVGQLGAHEAVNRLLRGKRPVTAEQRAIMEERLTTFSRLRPTHFISGTSGFIRYFGAKYADDFVVFENLRYGNALYVMFERWQELSQRSRIDLLKGDHEGFERIEHREGWEDRLEAMVERYRQTHRRR
jgi:hypothetical protein